MRIFSAWLLAVGATLLLFKILRLSTSLNDTQLSIAAIVFFMWSYYAAKEFITYYFFGEKG